MSKLCRISVVGLHLLLLTYITHSFVLLTANVDDLKKIARKFVSESLAERITDFLAEATKTMAEEQKNSEEQTNSEENKRSQVSVENTIPNVEKTVNVRLHDIIEKSLLAIDEAAVTPKRVNTEREGQQEAKHTKGTRSKTGKSAPKPLHGRSRYIEPVEIAEPTETSITTTRVEYHFKNLKESTQNIESYTRNTKHKTNNKTKMRFKLLSAFDTNTNTATDKAKINKKLENKPVKKSPSNPTRSLSGELAASPESHSYDTGYEYRTEKVVNEFDQYDNGNNEHTEKAANHYDYDNRRNTKTEGTGAPMSEKEQYDNEINNLIPRVEKELTGTFLRKENDVNEDKWRAKKLTTHKKSDADVQAESKTWF